MLFVWQRACPRARQVDLTDLPMSTIPVAASPWTDTDWSLMGVASPCSWRCSWLGVIHQVINRPSLVCTKPQAMSKPKQIASQACVRSMAGCPRVGNTYGCGVQTPKGNGEYARTRDSDRFAILDDKAYKPRWVLKFSFLAPRSAYEHKTRNFAKGRKPCWTSLRKEDELGAGPGRGQREESWSQVSVFYLPLKNRS